MRAPAAPIVSSSCWRALPVIAATLISIAAWAGSDNMMPPIPLDRPAVSTDGSDPVPPVTVAPHAAPTTVAVATPQGASGGDDRRIFMLMMMGQGMSGGPFGRLGQ